MSSPPRRSIASPSSIDQKEQEELRNVNLVTPNTYYQNSLPYDQHVSPRTQQAQQQQQLNQQQQQQGIRYGIPIASSNPSLPPPQQLLPLGAVPLNGGIYYTSNLFSNSYKVPGPNGAGWIFYDYSTPMPPVHAYPTLLEQWHQLTRLLKFFFICLIIFCLLVFLAHWRLGLCLPLVFVPTYLLYRAWSQHYKDVELYMLAHLYAFAFAPGAVVVMLVEGVVTVIFTLICFQSAFAKMLDPTNGSATSGGTKGGSDQQPDGLEFRGDPDSPGKFVFIFLLSFISAGCVEESLKYYCTSRVHSKYRPAYRHLKGYTLYAIASALGFSTMENIGYVIGGALGKGGDDSMTGIFLNTLGRVCISTPLHVMTGYLIGLQVIRRDLLGERISLFRVMFASVAFHGLFDYLLFMIMTLQSHWSSGPDDNLTSFVLMACTVAIVYAGLIYRIWYVRQKVFPQIDARPRVEHAEGGDEEAPASADGEAGAGAGAVHGEPVQHADGFQPLEQQPDSAV